MSDQPEADDFTSIKMTMDPNERDTLVGEGWTLIEDSSMFMENYAPGTTPYGDEPPRHMAAFRLIVLGKNE